MTDDIYEQIEQQAPKENPIDTIFKGLDKKVKILIAIMVVASVYFWYTEAITAKAMFLYVFCIILFIYLIRPSERQKLMDEPEVKASVLRYLLYKQTNTQEIPIGKIRMGLATVQRYLNGEPWKREVHFQLIGRDGLVEDWICDFLALYPGKVLSYKKKAMGYTGNNSPDIKYVLDPRSYYQQQHNRMSTTNEAEVVADE